MSHPESETVVGWIRGFREGNHDAACDLWKRYFERVVAVAKRRLAEVPRRAADEEDIAVSVLRCLCDGAGKGRFDEISNHDELWRLLLTITRQKCVDYIRHETRDKRGGGEVRGESVLGSVDGEDAAGFDMLVGQTLTPEYVAQIGEQFQQLLAAVPDQIPRNVVLMRMEGRSVDEIALKLGISEHAVRRKLKLVRTIWQNLSGDS